MAANRFIAALDDALLLGMEAGYVNRRKTAEKGSGGGINVESRAMYRAMAVIAVAAWEDFNEQLGPVLPTPERTASTQVDKTDTKK